MIASSLDCQLALAVRDLPDDRHDCVVLELKAGVCTAVRLAGRAEAANSVTYLLAGDYQAWQQIMAGFDMGKAVMYRKLLLEKGAVLDFFKSAYYWTESVACIQRVPSRF